MLSGSSKVRRLVVPFESVSARYTAKFIALMLILVLSIAESWASVLSTTCFLSFAGFISISSWRSPVIPVSYSFLSLFVDIVVFERSNLRLVSRFISIGLDWPVLPGDGRRGDGGVSESSPSASFDNCNNGSSSKQNFRC